jgi:hypothetical protein
LYRTRSGHHNRPVGTCKLHLGRHIVSDNRICARCGHQAEDHSGFGTYKPCNHYGIFYDGHVSQRENCCCYEYVELNANTLVFAASHDRFGRTS